MKTKLFVQMLGGAAKPCCAVGLALLLSGTGRVARAASATEALEKGIYTEETKGDLKAAMRIYEQIVDDPRADRSLAAQAQLRLGLCHLKLGDRAQAISSLDRLTNEFPDKDKLLAIVGEHMPQVLDEIVGQIDQNYIEAVDRGELMETAIRAIVGKLDSRGGLLRTNDLEFLGPEDLKELNAGIEQKIAGIGAVLRAEAGQVVVQGLLPGSPATAGGLRSGDRILGIDGTELPPNQLAMAVKLLRGPPGTKVTLDVMRPEEKETQQITLTRRTVRLPSVAGDSRNADGTWEFMLDAEKKIGYIRVTQFGRQTEQELRTVLETLQTSGMKGLILDLRNNPGGVLDGAVAVADLFVESGRIVTVKNRKEETVYDAKPEGTFTGFPVALLVNRRTASAAEIVAAALQDHQRAVVIGERTFGQGIVRTIVKLESGVGALKLPIAAYYRPNGKSMNRYPGSKDSDDWGVTPDPGYEVVLSDEEFNELLQKTSRLVSNEPTPKAEFEDRQLQKALEWLTMKMSKR